MSKVLALIAAWVLLLSLPYLGARELRYEEGRRAWPARELLERSDPVVPRALGYPYLAKPPGFPLAVALVSEGLEALGSGPAGPADPDPERGPVTPFALRLTALLGVFLAAAAAAQAVHWSGGSRRTGLLAGLLVALAPEGLSKARLGEIDFFFAGLCAWTALFAERSVRGPPRRCFWLGPAALLMGLAFYTKGPLALLFGLAPLVVGLVRPRFLAVPSPAGPFRRNRALLALVVLLGVGLTVGLWWRGAVAERLQLPADQLDRLWRSELLRPNPQTLGGYALDRVNLLFGGLLGFLPGTLGLLALVRSSQRSRFLEAPGVRPALALLLPGLLVLSLWPAVRVRYALPLLPPLAVLGAVWFEGRVGDLPWSLDVRRALRILTGLLAGGGLVAFCWLAWRLAAGEHFQVFRPWPAAVALLMAGTVRRSFLALRSSRDSELPKLCLLLLVLLRHTELSSLEPERWDKQACRQLASAIDAGVARARSAVDEPLYTDLWSDFNTLFFCSSVVQHVEDPEQLPGGALLLAREIPKGPDWEALGLDSGAEAAGFELYRRRPPR